MPYSVYLKKGEEKRVKQGHSWVYANEVARIEGKDKNGSLVRKQLEVDFVCNKGSKRYYVQSAFAIPDSEKMQQESNSLLRIDDSFKKIIVVKDAPAPSYTEDGLLVIGVYDFLLNDNSMDM